MTSHMRHSAHGPSALRGIFFGGIISAIGIIYVIQLAGNATFPIPQQILEYCVGGGCILGGFYMVYKAIFRHRIILG